MKNVLITLCARGGSKGVPNKNVKLLNGKPLLQYSIETAKKFSAANNHRFSCTIVTSSESEQIIDMARSLGISNDYIRPEQLATDSAGKVETISHLLTATEKSTFITYDYILDLDVSAPLRSVDDLNNALHILENDMAAFNLFSVSTAHRNPYFNMVEQGSDGYYKLVKPINNHILSRQKAPVVYDLNASFYYYRRCFFDEGFVSVLTEKALIYEVNHICFDIDNMIDFEIMEFLISQNKLDFDL